jgi:hypothetical protein
MISKSYGAYVVVCDICGEEMEETFGTFQDAVDGLKKEGWTSEEDEFIGASSRSWVNACLDCQEAE